MRPRTATSACLSALEEAGCRQRGCASPTLCARKVTITLCMHVVANGLHFTKKFASVSRAWWLWPHGTTSAETHFFAIFQPFFSFESWAACSKVRKENKKKLREGGEKKDSEEPGEQSIPLHESLRNSRKILVARREKKRWGRAVNLTSSMHQWPPTIHIRGWCEHICSSR